KSLRGKEMADCIFNGSGGRKPLNMAEVTLTFDNSKRMLPVESPEVHIGRRVYRSGESEYLINRQACRLRDIRDLFLGTGAATEAYSVIEQGKVDVLLQSSPKERREIFEEAAGVSRFKAKKIESLRKLERMDQNLVRLADLVVEVENQLKVVRSQAGKAQKYQEYTTRLQALRTQVGLADWRAFSSQIAAIEAEQESRKAEVEDARTRAQILEDESKAVEARLLDLDAQLQGRQRTLTANRERIAAADATINLERARRRDLDDETSRQRKRFVELNAQARGLRDVVEQTRKDVAASEAEFAIAKRDLACDEALVAEVNSQITVARQNRDQEQQRLRESLRSVAVLGGQISSLQSQVETSVSAGARARSRLEELDAAAADLERQLGQLRSTQEQLEENVQRAVQRLAQHQTRLNERREKRASVMAELSALQSKRAGVGQRVALLEDLEKRREGVSPGVKQVLAQSRDEPDGPFAAAAGLVADLFQVSVESAPLIEVALGDAAQQVVLFNAQNLYQHLADPGEALTGRVSFLPVTRSPKSSISPASEASDGDAQNGDDEAKPDAPSEPAEDDEPEDLPDEFYNKRGVIGRADRYVETTPEFAPLARRLLARTWIVQSLKHALSLAAERGGDWNYVTLAGEALFADGTLHVGPRHTQLGLISRRSELRELRTQYDELADQIKDSESQLVKLDQLLEQDESKLQELAEKRQQALDDLGRHRQRMGGVEGRLGQLAEQRSNVELEITAIQRQNQQASVALSKASLELAIAEEKVTESEAALSRLQGEIDQLEAQRSNYAGQLTSTKIVLAKREEQLSGLRSRLDQLARQQEEQRRAWADVRLQLDHNAQRELRTEAIVLRAESDLAHWYLEKERLAEEVRVCHVERDTIARQRQSAAQQAETVRHQIRYLEEKLHTRTLEANDLVHKRTALVERLREDYGLEIAEVEPTGDDPEGAARTAIDREIEDLRRKVAALGPVNMEALNALQDLESRFGVLSFQYKDLSQSKAQLEQIINKINAESRRLFSETLEAIRVHFQTLFRKLFGGGHADIVLEENADVLDGGIDIVAKPPGKELRNISLMSGGEKTMTCIALLMAIFRNRPSPFCVLDEVDAALDEANNERLNAILLEFLEYTQFIVVTHSKKTMTSAHMLYGVTMQESGISKRVSVRFEDVHDDGQIDVADVDDPVEDPGFPPSEVDSSDDGKGPAAA
ncbi:MAG TPA: hypothetical protein VGE52_07840, partial [Pirellulales bacterium]